MPSLELLTQTSSALTMTPQIKCKCIMHLIVTDDPDNLMVLTTNNSGTEAE